MSRWLQPLAALLLSIGGVQAPAFGARENVVHVIGTVTKIARDQIVVRTADGKDVLIALDYQVMVDSGQVGADGQPKDVKLGARIDVEKVRSKTGQWTVVSIRPEKKNRRRLKKPRASRAPNTRTVEPHAEPMDQH